MLHEIEPRSHRRRLKDFVTPECSAAVTGQQATQPTGAQLHLYLPAGTSPGSTPPARRRAPLPRCPPVSPPGRRNTFLLWFIRRLYHRLRAQKTSQHLCFWCQRWEGLTTAIPVGKYKNNATVLQARAGTELLPAGSRREGPRGDLGGTWSCHPQPRWVQGPRAAEEHPGEVAPRTGRPRGPANSWPCRFLGSYQVAASNFLIVSGGVF